MVDDKSWFSNYQHHDTAERFKEIRTFAYLVFDEIDKNGNGFIEYDELAQALESPHRSDRERSFISFLLNNQDAISESFDEGIAGAPEGISRKDIEAYFELILSLL